MLSFPAELVGEFSPARLALTGLVLIGLRWLSIVAMADARRRVAIADAKAGIAPVDRPPRKLGGQKVSAAARGRTKLR